MWIGGWEACCCVGLFDCTVGMIIVGRLRGLFGSGDVPELVDVFGLESMFGGKETEMSV